MIQEEEDGAVGEEGEVGGEAVIKDRFVFRAWKIKVLNVLVVK